MSAITMYSQDKDAGTAVREIADRFASITPKMVLYFASVCYNQDELAREMKRAFPKAAVLGCSTAGEITTGRMLNNSCVAMAFDEDSIEKCYVEVAVDIKNPTSVREVFKTFESRCTIPMKQIDPKEYIGLLLIDGMQKAEEIVMETIGSLTDVSFVGGSAGDDMRFRRTWVNCNGLAYPNGAVFALIKPKKGFDIIKTQSFRLLRKRMVATQVDEANRTVMEFNNIPAAQAYAQAVGVPEEELPEKFMNHPVGILMKDDIYVRSPQQLQGRAVVFYCAVKKDMIVEVLESADIVEDTAKALKKTMEKINNPAGLINFNCILRTLALEQNNQIERYGALFKDVPTVGFSTYGEQYRGHINQTATMVVIH